MNSIINPSMPCFVFCKDLLLLAKGNPDETDTEPLRVPVGGELPHSLSQGRNIHFVQLPQGDTIQTFSIEEPVPESDRWTHRIGLRASYDIIPLPDYKAAGKAFQIVHWDLHTLYCPVCGNPTEQQTPIMKKCTGCGYELYPRINTAIIVLIRRGDEILLVRARNFRSGFHGLVAGFLEPGETLEECVHREVMEETGLKIKNIRYIASQPWPYPSGLMCGFTAEYDSGRIKLQDEELMAGAFYRRDNLPTIPQKLSIARKLIDAWIERKI